MYSQEDKNQDAAQCPAEDGARSACGLSSISTERIMQAVEERRQVSQQLEDLRFQQKQRTARLRGAGLKLMCVLWCVTGGLVGGFILLLIMQPALLDRTLSALDDNIALLIALVERARQGAAQTPSGNWLLSASALVVVLLTGLWIRLMRYPQDA